MSSVAQEPLLATSVTHVAGPSRPTEFDPFFKSSSDGILKTYEFTYDALTSFKQELAFSFLVAEAFVPPVCPFIVCCGMPFFYLCQKQNIRDAAHAQHLAITHDGIKYVVDKHKSGCRFDCQVTELYLPARRIIHGLVPSFPERWSPLRVLTVGARARPCAGPRQGLQDGALRQDDGL